MGQLERKLERIAEVNKQNKYKVPGAGLEPARPQQSQDFKSCVSTIPPPG